MTLVTSYNPDSEVCCPKCAEIVHCKNIGGITFGTNPHLDFRHEKCGTEWRYYIDTQKSETPIPKPMTLKECMGESSARPAGYMPWNRSELIGWSIVGMNHYHINGARYLFCAMTKDGKCITAESGVEHEVFNELARKAEGI